MKQTDDNRFSDVPVRIRSWIIIIFLVCVSLLHPLLTSLAVAVLSWQAMREYYRMNPLSSATEMYFLYLLLPLQFYCTFSNDYSLFVFLLPVYLAGYILCDMAFTYKQRKTIRYYGTLVAGVLICLFSTAHLAFIRNIGEAIPGLNGVKVFFFLILLTELNDVFQYMTGKLFGKRKVFPRISPNKTEAGFLGGMVLTTALANGLGIWLVPQGTVFVYSLLGLGISLLGICGDMYMSVVKRKAGVKDTGSLIPGHGGLLDRIDSLTFVAPAFYGIIYLIFK